MKNKLDKMFENDFIRLPRPFIRRFNLNTAVMLSEIYSEYTYWRDRGGLQDGGWFYSTIENIYYNTGLSKHQQLIASKELENYGRKRSGGRTKRGKNNLKKTCSLNIVSFGFNVFFDGLFHAKPPNTELSL